MLQAFTDDKSKLQAFTDDKSKRKEESKSLSSSQINQWLEFAFNSDDKKLVEVFIIRQAKRQHLDKGARKMIEIFQSKNMSIGDIRKFLGLIKWLVEADINAKTIKSARNFSELITLYSAGG